ncbi:MAG: beta-ketoacyl-[acyl-carrier-protein] synthase family protein [Planctomycetaceae bacterium]|nr:beta-ketoacyl-[acyl-carrier-protein] synthase family protein [Planctomycetaceae bacterium]MBT4012746.1 beta-ketoacyl-[acyl-carrier-protein] synthase family protein [Planctomycetaceae bacterium]MBT4723750.1 beta-ketoacyl-[acyl-carrier-protein] synthase family protein [Planctomycetaceae bacterium]MBT5126073.1 beta-ketoacyl-[acyl-carrier-protein] synthase family protein [Planctomycetaceae bacterium]MBT5883561.1 beta-ketoacyl-[acyl-carrier-protein] synthase family protein [Planctomycetaceae bact
MTLQHHQFTPPTMSRIVITGIGLTAPNGNNLLDYRKNLLDGVSGVQDYEIRYVGKTLAGICDFDALKHQNRREIRRGTRAGSIAIYCCNEAIANSQIDWGQVDHARTGIYLGVTEHGNVETENEIYELSQFDYDVSVWNHFHNPRTVANNPAGEAALNMEITGPHYTIGAACAAGNSGLIQGAQMLQLGQCDVALAGGVSESIHTFGIFASFKSQGALAQHPVASEASRPFDVDRTGIVVSEGGCVYVLERLDDALARGARIYGELVGYSINTDATDFVLPNPERQSQCVQIALGRAGITPADVDILSTHATGTKSGDIQEIAGLRKVFQGNSNCSVNNTKSFIGHTMGAAGALELAGNLPAFDDNICHATINVDQLDEECDMDGLVLNTPQTLESVDYIVNNSFGMLGINSTVVIKKFTA